MSNFKKLDKKDIQQIKPVGVISKVVGKSPDDYTSLSLDTGINVFKKKDYFTEKDIKRINKKKDIVNPSLNLQKVKKDSKTGKGIEIGLNIGKKQKGIFFKKTFKRGGDVMPARNKKNFRPTEKGAGMTAAGVAAYRKANPGSKLKTAVTGKVKPGSKDAKRRKSFCARSLGQMKKFPKAAKDPNSRLRQARRRWKC
tara:strand:- start:288 stop:878 length:591 start_codon:yes stop_codon:yes gene_type:complete